MAGLEAQRASMVQATPPRQAKEGSPWEADPEGLSTRAWGRQRSATTEESKEVWKRLPGRQAGRGQVRVQA